MAWKLGSWVKPAQVVDLRTVSFDVPPQEILTKDSVTVAVDAVVYYKVGTGRQTASYAGKALHWNTLAHAI